VASIDVPSGWHVEKGNVNNTFEPDLLISLTAPKECAKFVKCDHYLGGRFVPKALAEKYNISLGKYEGSKQIFKL